MFGSRADSDPVLICSLLFFLVSKCEHLILHFGVMTEIGHTRQGSKLTFHPGITTGPFNYRIKESKRLMGQFLLQNSKGLEQTEGAFDAGLFHTIEHNALEFGDFVGL